GGGLQPHPGYATSPAYAASKAGLIMLSKKLALELAPVIRVNCIAPGVIDSKPTPMSEAARARFAAETPLRRVGAPRDIAEADVVAGHQARDDLGAERVRVDHQRLVGHGVEGVRAEYSTGAFGVDGARRLLEVAEVVDVGDLSLGTEVVADHATIVVVGVGRD